MDSETKRAALQEILRRMAATCGIGAASDGRRKLKFETDYHAAVNVLRTWGYVVTYDTAGLPVVSAPDCEK